MCKGIDLSELYSLRKDFTIIALTGRTGSGCTTVAKQISEGFNPKNFPDPRSFNKCNHNSYYKYSSFGVEFQV